MNNITTFRKISEISLSLGRNWSSKEIGRIQGIGLKLFSVDPDGLPPESHPNYDEGLLMLDGQITLQMDGEHITLSIGDFQTIPKGCVHSILPGGKGAFLLIDPEPSTSETQASTLPS